MADPKDTDLQKQQFENERLMRENAALRGERSARQTEHVHNQRLARENQAIRTEQRARQAANNTNGMFVALLIVLLGLLGFGTFYFLGRSDPATTETQPQPEQQDGIDLIPEVNVEVPTPDVDINLPDVTDTPTSEPASEQEVQAEPSQSEEPPAEAAPDGQGE